MSISALDKHFKFEQWLLAGARTFGLALSEKEIAQFSLFLAFLKRTNQKINLTTITEDPEIVVKHFLDSLSGALFVQGGEPVLDVGTGAGFPGLPLRLVFSSLQLTLIEASKKKVVYLRELCEVLSLPKVKVEWGRAEDLGHTSRYREKFGLVVSRALAKLSVVCELCLPFVKQGGALLVWKGPAGQGELEETEAQGVIDLLGGKVAEVKSFQLPYSRAERHLIFIRKVSVTPHPYSRRAGLPQKRPLGLERVGKY